ncbi:MAG: TIM barrel protein [Phycisphaera sp.]|nr:TIM barrel protein [Phycisphaera sp.]
MRFGCCVPPDNAPLAKELGFDFIEVNVQKILQGELDDADWAAQAVDPDKTELPMEAANGLVPGTLPIVGPARDLSALKTYMQRVASRAHKLGIEALVFGSGGARKRPDDTDEKTTDDHLADFLKIAGDACAPHNVTIVIEHLNKKETNTLNSLASVKALADRVNHPAIQTLIDTYHFGMEGESLDTVATLGPSIRHVHVAEPNGRRQPGAPDGQPFDFVAFFRKLRAIGYHKRLSVEARWEPPIAESGSACTAFLRQAWDAAGR